MDDKGQNTKRRIAILGSTGSIGRQALDVIRQHPDLFEVELLTANTSSGLLIEQAVEFQPNNVVICDGNKYDEVNSALSSYDIKVFTGMDSVCDLVQGDNIDIVLTAIVGISGLSPTLAAIRAGKTIALANKETLVAAGSIVMDIAKVNGVPIVPVDSEHSAIFQCLNGESYSPVEKILLTGSGGPFLHTTADVIRCASVKDALNHPRWRMGTKVSIDSASLMNKGLELIEARWLFDVKPDNIEVIIHPQSIIHSMVQFCDGSIIAQMGYPDMRIPIQYALSFPCRIPLNSRRVSFTDLKEITFEAPDCDRFPCLDIARKAIAKGGNMPCIMNAANEIAVAAFLQERIGFGQIPEIIFQTMDKCEFDAHPDIDTIYKTDMEARTIASDYIRI